MKRCLQCIFCAAFIVLMILCGSVRCFAEEISVSPEALTDEETIGREAEKVYGEFSPEKLLKKAAEALKSAYTPSLPIFAGLLGLILISAILNAFELNFGGFDIGGYVSALCFSGYGFSVIKCLCDNLSIYTGKLRDIMTVVAPTLVAASAADGVMTAGTGYAGLAISLSVIEYLVTSVVLPCVKILFVLSLVSCMTGKNVDLRGIASSLRTFSIFAVSLLMTVLVAVIHFRSVIARAADSIGMRAVRFASVSFVPFVGGLVGESVKTVTEALSSVRGIAGAAGVAAIISACLPPLAAIVVYKIEIILCTCLAKTLGCTAQAGILSETGGIINVLNAALICATVGFSAMICVAACAV